MDRSVRKHFSIAGIILALMLVSFSFFSCKKDGETKAIVIVNDSLGSPVEGASVTLWQDTTVNKTTQTKSDIRVTKTTDSKGEADFVFALEAYLNITATKGSHIAKGFIRLKQNETTSQTVHF